MKIIDVAQGSEQWLAARAGIPTASELDRLVSPLGKIREGEGVQTYLCEKLAERWTGYPLASYSGGVMEQGAILEEEAIPWYEAEFDEDVRRVGFLTTDDGKFGCSPDGLLTKTTAGLELKCPQPVNHVKWLLRGEVPKEHLLQCQGGMYVTGLPAWRFVSYCRGFPPLVADVARDETLIGAIELAARSFSVNMEAAYATLERANGGPPRRRAARAPLVTEDPDFM